MTDGQFIILIIYMSLCACCQLVFSALMFDRVLRRLEGPDRKE